MEAVVRDKEWKTFNRTDHSVAGASPARELWRKLAYATWRCGDPGVQFDDVTNELAYVPELWPDQRLQPVPFWTTSHA